MKILLISIGLIPLLCSVSAFRQRRFPSNFKFGASTSAYQIEGAWNEDGKGPNMWDYLTHSELGTKLIEDGSNGDVACDSYHKLDEDVAMLKNLGVHYYRFSISWSRILPDGTTKQINPKGVLYYAELINKLKAAGIEPMVTIYHFDLPQSLQAAGGWVNQTLIQRYVDYARLLFTLYGNDVKTWITFNEPKIVCVDFLEVRSTNPGVETYQCARNVILAHAKVWRIYNQEFRPHQKGRISIVLNTDWNEPASRRLEDIKAAQRKRMFEFGMFAHPIYYGQFPDVMIETIARRSGSKSRLPLFNKSESTFIKGTHDFLGINHYTSNLVKNQPDNNDTSSFYQDMELKFFYDPKWENTSLSWLKVVPWGFRKLLRWTHETYNGTEIIITENGYVDGGTIHDPGRIRYFRDYLSEALNAIYLDGVRLTAYCTWSLMDNFEWASGYTQKFGLYHVNFTSPNRERIPKTSVAYFKKIVATGCVNDYCY